MAFTWDPAVIITADFTDLAYSLWKFRQKAGISQQDSAYEGALSDEIITDMLTGHQIEVAGIDYYQPLTALAFFIESDPEQRTESMEGDAMEKWVDPEKRALALRREQEILNRSLIPGYVAVSVSFPGPVLTAWNCE